jgi:hypothetical protein
MSHCSVVRSMKYQLCDVPLWTYMGLVLQHPAAQHLIPPVWDQWVLKYFWVFLEFLQVVLLKHSSFKSITPKGQ